MKVVIVGGSAGGVSAAARLRRLDERAEILLLERGMDLAPDCRSLPDYRGGRPKWGRAPLHTPKSMKERFRVDVRVGCEVLHIHRTGKELTVLNRNTGEVFPQSYDKLVLAPGAAPAVSPVRAADAPRVFTLGELTALGGVKAYVKQNRPAHAVVVGGDPAGLELAEGLARAGVSVALVEPGGQILAPLDPEMANLIHRELANHGVDLCLGAGLCDLRREDGRLVCVLADGRLLSTDVLLRSGDLPETGLPAGQVGLELEESGALRVNESLRTSDPHIYAIGAGAVLENLVSGQGVYSPLAGWEDRQGRVVAGVLAGRAETYEKTGETMLCKAFGLSAGAVGSGEKELRQRGAAYDKVYVHPGFPPSGALRGEGVSVKLLFHPETGRVLGAQAVGKGAVDRSMDVLAAAVQTGLRVFDLEKLELCRPPFTPGGRDPVHVACATAANALRGEVKQCFWEELSRLDPEGDILVDLRTRAEHAGGTIGDAVSIPLEEIRGRLGDLPRNKRLILFCATGQGGYLGCRILMGHGFDRVYNLSGGYRTWRSARGMT